MTRPNLIGLAGYARVGKDTVGAILTEEFGYERRAFADKLRELAWRVDPALGQLVQEHGYEGVKTMPVSGPWMRELLVALGAGAREVLGGEVWLDACLPAKHGVVRRNWLAQNKIVVTDVRYPNEAQRVIDLGGQVWYIIRPEVGPANDEEARSISALLHQCSVRALVNDGPLESLHWRVRGLLGE